MSTKVNYMNELSNFRTVLAYLLAAGMTTEMIGAKEVEERSGVKVDIVGKISDTDQCPSVLEVIKLLNAVGLTLSVVAVGGNDDALNKFFEQTREIMK